MIDKFLTEFVLAYMIENKAVIMIFLLALGNEVMEYWLGKTDKVKAGSKLELIFQIIAKIKSAAKF